MANSARIGLPFLDAAQAQKHVTVNEALARLDMAASARVETMGTNMPPAAPTEGEAHIVAAGPGGDWTGQDGNVAIFLNGGWDFVAPWAGWRVWVAEETGTAVYDGTAWQLAQQPVSAGGALSALRIAEIDHVLSSGPTSETSAFIPDKAVVLGVTGRVVAAISGPASWDLGVTGSANRYGTGFGVAAGSFAHGVSGTPLTYYGESSLLLSANAGIFTGGTVRLAVHYFEISPPRAV